MPDLPPDPITAMQEGAAQIHEFTKSLEDTGYSHTDAIYLTGQMIQALVARAK